MPGSSITYGAMARCLAVSVVAADARAHRGGTPFPRQVPSLVGAPPCIAYYRRPPIYIGVLWIGDRGSDLAWLGLGLGLASPLAGRDPRGAVA